MIATTKRHGPGPQAHPRSGHRWQNSSLIVDGWTTAGSLATPADDPRIAFAAVVVNDPQKLWHIGTHLAALPKAPCSATPRRVLSRSWRCARLIVSVDAALGPLDAGRVFELS